MTPGPALSTTTYGEENRSVRGRHHPCIRPALVRQLASGGTSYPMLSSFGLCCPGKGQDLLSQGLQLGGAGIALLSSWPSRYLSRIPARVGKGRWGHHLCAGVTPLCNRVSSPTLTPSKLAHPHPCHQNQLSCASWVHFRACSAECCQQWKMGPTLWSSISSEGQGQICTAPGHPVGPPWLPWPRTSLSFLVVICSTGINTGIYGLPMLWTRRQVCGWHDSVYVCLSSSSHVALPGFDLIMRPRHKTALVTKARVKLERTKDCPLLFSWLTYEHHHHQGISALRRFLYSGACVSVNVEIRGQFWMA